MTNSYVLAKFLIVSRMSIANNNNNTGIN